MKESPTRNRELWFRELPLGWRVEKFKALIANSNAGEVIDKSFWHDGNQLLFTCQRAPLNSSFDRFPATKRTRENDLLVTRNGTPYVHLPPVGSIYSNVVQRCSLKRGVIRHYVAQSLAVACETLKGEGYGVSIASFSFDKWRNVVLPLPPEKDQKRIIAYLDEATIRIDRLIDLRRRQIELLREQQASLIQEAVTGGVDRRKALKDSGVAWIGQMPRDWRLLPLRAVLMERGEFNTNLQTTNFLSVIKDIGVVPYEEREASGNKKSDEMEKYKIVYPGDIVANRMNLIFGSVGLSAYFGCSSTEYYVLRARNLSVDTRFYGLIFQSKAFQQSLVGIGTGILAHRMRIYYEALKTILLPVPPLEQQQEIVAYVGSENRRFDALHQAYERQLELLAEYRAALIHECVTGQRTVSEPLPIGEAA